jgi:hypothetical protein
MMAANNKNPGWQAGASLQLTWQWAAVKSYDIPLAGTLALLPFVPWLSKGRRVYRVACDE